MRRTQGKSRDWTEGVNPSQAPWGLPGHLSPLHRYGYNCVIYGWDPTCMMGHEWIRNMNVHSLPHGHHQPFYNVLVEDGSCRYAAQGKAPPGPALTMLWAELIHCSEVAAAHASHTSARTHGVPVLELPPALSLLSVHTSQTPDF